MADDESIQEIKSANNRNVPAEKPVQETQSRNLTSSGVGTVEKKETSPGDGRSTSTMSREAQSLGEKKEPDAAGASSASHFADLWKRAVSDTSDSINNRGEKSPGEAGRSEGSLQSAHEARERMFARSVADAKDTPAKDTQAKDAQAKDAQAKDAQAKESRDIGKFKERLENLHNLGMLGTKIGDFKNLRQDIEKNGFTKENIAQLKGLQPYLEKAITKENIEFLKNRDPENLEKLLKSDMAQKVFENFPELKEKFSKENVEKFKGNLENLQKNLDKDKIGGLMGQMAPWVDTANGEGTLNMLARMIGDPGKLGGADKTLSQEDFREIYRGVLNTQTGYNEISNKVWNDPRVQFRKSGRERWDIGKRKAHEIGMGMASNPDFMAEQIKQKQQFLGSRGLPDSTVPRQFTEGEMQNLLQAARRAQSMGLGQGITGQNEAERTNSLLKEALAPIKKSIDPSDGISHEEVKNIADVANISYELLGKLYLALGGSYSQE